MGKRYLAFVFLLGMLVPARAGAIDSDWTRASLKRITGVSIDVWISPQLRDAGVDSSAVRTDVELRLRQAGLTIAANDNSYFGPLLSCSLDGLPACGDTQFAVSAKIGLSRMFDSDLRAKTEDWVYAESWSSSYIIAIGKNRLGELRDTARDLADRFLNAYLAANPKAGKAR